MDTWSIIRASLHDKEPLRCIEPASMAPATSAVRGMQHPLRTDEQPDRPAEGMEPEPPPRGRRRLTQEVEEEVTELIHARGDRGLTFTELMVADADEEAQMQRFAAAERMVRGRQARRQVRDPATGEEVPAAEVVRLRREEPDSPLRDQWEVIYVSNRAPSQRSDEGVPGASRSL